MSCREGRKYSMTSIPCQQQKLVMSCRIVIFCAPPAYTKKVSMPQPSRERKKMQKVVMLFVIILFVSVVQVNAQSTPQSTPEVQATPDAELIKQTALDYIEGFYEGNAERMERALHPDLAKRIVQKDQRGRSTLGQMGAMRLVQMTRMHEDKIPKEKQQKDVTVLDIFGNAASAK